MALHSVLQTEFDRKPALQPAEMGRRGEGLKFFHASEITSYQERESSVGSGKRDKD